MGWQVWEGGESECHSVIEWTGVESMITSPHAKAGRLPPGVSSRENLVNSLYAGKQMTAGYGLADAPVSGGTWLPQVSIVKYG
jgi:hypothetical protein